jgi:hypothetical protein
MMSFEDDCFVILIFKLKCLSVYRYGLFMLGIGIINSLYITVTSATFEMGSTTDDLVLSLQFSLSSFFPRFSMTKKVKIVFIY